MVSLALLFLSRFWRFAAWSLNNVFDCIVLTFLFSAPEVTTTDGKSNIDAY